MASFGPANGNSHVTTDTIDIFGYAAPEYLESGKLVIYLNSTIKINTINNIFQMYSLMTCKLASHLYVNSENNFKKQIQIQIKKLKN